MSGEWTHIDSVSSRPLSPSDFLFEDTHDASSTEPSHEDSRRIGERGAAVESLHCCFWRARHDLAMDLQCCRSINLP